VLSNCTYTDDVVDTVVLVLLPVTLLPVERIVPVELPVEEPVEAEGETGPDADESVPVVLVAEVV
jgi:hypothetical protein